MVCICQFANLQCFWGTSLYSIKDILNVIVPANHFGHVIAVSETKLEVSDYKGDNIDGDDDDEDDDDDNDDYDGDDDEDDDVAYFELPQDDSGRLPLW